MPPKTVGIRCPDGDSVLPQKHIPVITIVTNRNYPETTEIIVNHI